MGCEMPFPDYASHRRKEVAKIHNFSKTAKFFSPSRMKNSAVTQYDTIKYNITYKDTSCPEVVVTN